VAGEEGRINGMSSKVGFDAQATALRRGVGKNEQCVGLIRGNWGEMKA
jgi:hypothetical protein